MASTSKNNERGKVPKKRRVCSFSDSWKEEYPWIKKVARSPQLAFCQVCCKEFSVTDGKCHVKQHADTQTHRDRTAAGKSSAMVTSFFTPSGDSILSKKVAATEAAICYHNVKHHLSYSSLACGVRLIKEAIQDSKITPAIHVGRTKATAIVKGVLQPYAVDKIRDEVSGLPYCLGIDASNHGHRKLFPICLRYFTDELREVVLDFYEDSFEDSLSIKNRISESLLRHEIDVNLMTCYRADNASVNYGINKSVFTSLKNDGLNLIKANCNDHMLHNCVRNSLKPYSLDIENVILKAYAEFSISAKKVEHLKNEFEEADLTYQAMVRHAVTRWLTLFEALSRFLKNLRPIKSYFLSLGEDKCPRVLWDLFKDQANEVADEDKPTLSELKLCFVHSLMSEFQKALLALQSNNTLACHLHPIVVDLKTSLREKIKQKFYGMTFLLAKRKGYLHATELQNFEDEASRVYDRALKYLEKWFPQEKELFYEKLRPLDLETPPSLEQVVAIVEEDLFKDKCPVLNDDLFQEVQLLQRALPKLEGTTLEKWTHFFKVTDAPFLKKIFQVVASIPVSNAFVERVFSVMEKVWVDDRNRLLVDSVKAELIVFFNLKYTCNEFLSVVSNDDKLCRAVRQSTKYENAI